MDDFIANEEEEFVDEGYESYSDDDSENSESASEESASESVNMDRFFESKT